MTNMEMLQEMIDFLLKEIEYYTSGDPMTDNDRAVNAHVLVVSTLQLILKNMEDGYE